MTSGEEEYKIESHRAGTVDLMTEHLIQHNGGCKINTQKTTGLNKYKVIVGTFYYHFHKN